MLKLDEFEKRRVEDRAYCHWRDQQAKGNVGTTWTDYWKINKKQYLANAAQFKNMLNDTNFNRYLFDYESNPWTLWNIQTMNG